MNSEFFKKLPPCSIGVEVRVVNLEQTDPPSVNNPTNAKTMHEIRVTFSHNGYATLYAEFLRDSVASSDLANNLDVSHDSKAKTVSIHILDSTLSLMLKDLSGSVFKFATESEAESWGRFTKLWKQDADLEAKKRRISQMWEAEQFCTTLNLSETKVRGAMSSLYEAEARRTSKRDREDSTKKKERKEKEEKEKKQKKEEKRKKKEEEKEKKEEEKKKKKEDKRRRRGAVSD
jgi:hypothetical protein